MASHLQAPHRVHLPKSTDNGFDFEAELVPVVKVAAAPSAEFSEEEKNNIELLMKKLGL